MSLRVGSWLAAANLATSDFPLENLPFGALQVGAGAHLAVAIGDQALDLTAAHQAGLLATLPEVIQSACLAGVLNPLMALGPAAVRALRHHLRELFRAGAPAQPHVEPLLQPQTAAQLCLPVQVGDFTDFYASLDHAANVGRLFRPTSPLLPNYKYVPIGYHGRSSSLGVSPANVVRPMGQIPAATLDGVPPSFGPTRQLDYEAEFGALVGAGNPLGRPVPLAEARDHLFGLVLLNDWSARDIQRWEYQPLGPFLGKSFATTLSPWVVTMEALEPFRVPAPPRPVGDPAPLAYLQNPQDAARGGFDIVIEVWLQSRRMRERGIAAVRLSRGNLRDLYWTLGQMVAHHTSNGCNLRPGDLLGTGTVSGPSPEARGCLLELTEKGATSVKLPEDENRTFLHDGDQVTLRAYAQHPEGWRLGWGECRGEVVAAL